MIRDKVNNTSQPQKAQRARIIAFLIAAALLAALLVSFLWPWHKPISIATTPGGVAFEQLMSQQTSRAFVMNPSTQLQYALWKTIAPAFVGDHFNGLSLALNDLFIKPTKPLPDELRELVYGSRRFALSFSSQDVDDSAPSEAEAAAPQIITFFTEVGTHLQARELLAAMNSSDKRLRAPPSAEATYYRPGLLGDEYEVGLVSDVLFITTGGRDEAELILSRFNHKSSSLAELPALGAMASRLPPQLAGYFYIAAPTGPRSASSTLDLFGGESGARLTSFEAEARSLRLHSVFDSSPGQEEAAQTVAAPLTADFISRLPLEGLLFYDEGRKFGAGTSDNGSLSELTDLLPLPRETINAVLDGEYALVVQDVAALTPSVSLYIDVSDTKDEARALLRSLHTSLKQVVTLFAQQLGQSAEDASIEPFVTQHNLVGSLFTGGRLTLYPARIPPALLNLPLLGVFVEPIDLTYGVTSDGLLVFSTHPGIEALITSSASAKKSAELTMLPAHLGPPGQLTYVSLQGLRAVVSDLVAAVDRRLPLDPSQKVLLDNLQLYFGGVSGYVQKVFVNNGRVSAEGVFTFRSADL